MNVPAGHSENWRVVGSIPTGSPSFLSDISTGSLSEASFKLFISTYDVK